MLRRTIATVMLLGTGVAQAEESGFYAGVGIGQGKISDDTLPFDGDDTAFKLFGGYQINRNVAAELSYTDLGTPSDTVNGFDVDFNGSAFQTSLLGILPFSANLSGFLRAGILFWDATASIPDLGFSVDDSGNDFAWGIGLEFGSERVRGRAEFEGADVEGTDFKLFSISFAYRFQP